MIRIAFLGAGDVAARHADGLVRAGDVEIASVTDPIGERAVALAETVGIERVEDDPEVAMTRADIDAVLLLTPHHLHAPQAITAFRAGKHVICEKPLARTVAECDAMLGAARSSGKRLFVTHVLRTVFFFEKARERVEAGALGRLTLGSFTWYTDELPRLEDPEHWKGTVEESGGGVLIDGGCHASDVGNWLFGKAVRVSALASKLVTKRDSVGEDTATFQVEYESGAFASFALSFIAGSGLRPGRFACGMDVDLFGTEGHIEGGYRFRDDDHRHYCTEHHSGAPDRVHEVEHVRSYGDIDLAIIDALRGDTEPPVTAIEARNAVAVVEAAYRSIESGKTVEVDWIAG